MTDSTANTPNDPAGPWAIPVRRPLPGEGKPRSTTSVPRKVWHLLVGIKDALALIFLLLFFVALFGLLSGRPNAGLPVSQGALLIELDGIVSEQPSEVDPLAALSGGAQLKEIRVRDVVQALEVAADDKRVTSVVLDLDRFLGGGQVSLAEIGAAVDKVRAKKKPVLAFATAYTTDSYQVAAHASEIWADGVGGVAIAGPGGSRLYYKGLMDRLGVTAHIYRAGTFKSAVEPFLRTDQSPEAKEADLAYASVLWDNWLTDVKKARPAAKLDAFIADTAGAVRAAGNDLSKASVDAGLVDKVGSRMAFNRRVAEISGAADDSKPWEYNAIPLENWVAANPPSTSGSRIAVVPVVGEIVDGEAPSGVAGGESVAKHILDAATDSSVPPRRSSCASIRPVDRSSRRRKSARRCSPRKRRSCRSSSRWRMSRRRAAIGLQPPPTASSPSPRRSPVRSACSAFCRASTRRWPRSGSMPTASRRRRCRGSPTCSAG